MKGETTFKLGGNIMEKFCGKIKKVKFERTDTTDTTR